MSNVTALPVRDHRHARPEDHKANEVSVLRNLMAKGRSITIESTVHDLPFTGPLVWHDVYNIAIRYNGKIKVFPRQHIASWEYD